MKPVLPITAREAGFTLVEMLVALLLFAMIAAAGVGLLRGSADTQAAVDTSLDRGNRLERLHAMLAADMAQLVDRPTRVTNWTRPSFVGRADSMQLVRNGYANVDDSARGNLQRLEWRRDGSNLVRRAFARVDGDSDASDASDAALLDGIDRLAFRFRGRDGTWNDSYQTSPGVTLPVAVEVTVERRGQPKLVMIFATDAPQQSQPLPEQAA